MELDILWSKSDISSDVQSVTTWLAKELKLKECQMIPQQEIGKLGISSTEEKQLTVACKVNWLSQEVSSFLSKAVLHLESQNSDEIYRLE